MWNGFKRLRIVAGSCERGKEPSGFHKTLEFVGQLRKCQLLNDCSIAQNGWPWGPPRALSNGRAKVEVKVKLSL
jgi:hypothetical protein